MKKFVMVLGIVFSSFFATNVYAHCQIPCGIYDDGARFTLLYEYIATMDKSISKIKELSKKTDAYSKNQLVRWVINKDKHAEKFKKILWQYFFTQRIKPVSPENKDKYHKYLREVELIHQLSFYAMKVKQNVDTKYTQKLIELLKEFEELYTGKKDKDHHH
ncbi:superoxide dismutase [Ni] [Persephonella sp. IF05-L8]|uniref:superoxide dismutase [Ni] n=1 Tax=Persephonella sp. IF05-L8 TaxID=1158338 RepID=UPI000497A182